MGLTGTIYNIQKFSIHDGPGIRTTVFFKGCPLSCWWCHNPESRSPEIQCMNGRSIGKQVTVDEVMETVQQDAVFYEESGGGVTFSGGEPLSQPGFLESVLRKSRDLGFHTAIDTSGYAPMEQVQRMIPLTDLFLYDLKLMDEKKHIRYTSVSNKPILKNLRMLLTSDARTIIRIPLITGITDRKENLEQILEFLKPFSPLPEIHLLPYHRTAGGKYDILGMKNHILHLKSMSDSEARQHLQLFEDAGYKTMLGG